MKEYSNKDITVYWDPDLCTHVANCLIGSPTVFNIHKRPWVNINGASPEEIIRTIDTCPTGALQYSLPEGSSVDPALGKGPGARKPKVEDQSQSAISIKVLPNGPLMVDGSFQLIDVNGQISERSGKTILCRCGLTEKRPFCDGTHAKKGWKADA